MANVYINSGSEYTPYSSEDLKIEHALPVGTYTIVQSMWDGLKLKKLDDIVLPSQIYGNVSKIADRVLTTFDRKEGSTGVLMSGDAGSGKTLTSKIIAYKAAARGIITIIITKPYCGDDFRQLIQSIDQPCIVLFEEFEKVYGHREQGHLLTMFDGIYASDNGSKKLFIITCNDEDMIVDQMHNRPGRMHYALDFTGVGESFVRDYCSDLLEDKSQIEAVVQVASGLKPFTIDMLRAIVDEMNMHNETVDEVMKLLNVGR